MPCRQMGGRFGICHRVLLVTQRVDGVEALLRATPGRGWRVRRALRRHHDHAWSSPKASSAGIFDRNDFLREDLRPGHEDMTGGSTSTLRQTTCPPRSPSGSPHPDRAPCDNLRMIAPWVHPWGAMRRCRDIFSFTSMIRPEMMFSGGDQHESGLRIGTSTLRSTCRR